MIGVVVLLISMRRRGHSLRKRLWFGASFEELCFLRVLGYFLGLEAALEEVTLFLRRCIKETS